MRRGIGVVVGLDLDDPTAHTLEQHRRANEIARDGMDVAGKERAAKRTRHDWSENEGGCLIKP